MMSGRRVNPLATVQLFDEASREEISRASCVRAPGGVSVIARIAWVSDVKELGKKGKKVSVTAEILSFSKTGVSARFGKVVGFDLHLHAVDPENKKNLIPGPIIRPGASLRAEYVTFEGGAENLVVGRVMQLMVEYKISRKKVVTVGDDGKDVTTYVPSKRDDGQYFADTKINLFSAARLDMDLVRHGVGCVESDIASRLPVLAPNGDIDKFKTIISLEIGAGPMSNDATESKDLQAVLPFGVNIAGPLIDEEKKSSGDIEIRDKFSVSYPFLMHRHGAKPLMVALTGQSNMASHQWGLSGRLWNAMAPVMLNKTAGMLTFVPNDNTAYLGQQVANKLGSYTIQNVGGVLNDLPAMQLFEGEKPDVAPLGCYVWPFVDAVATYSRGVIVNSKRVLKALSATLKARNSNSTEPRVLDGRVTIVNYSSKAAAFYNEVIYVHAHPDLGLENAKDPTAAVVAGIKAGTITIDNTIFAAIEKDEEDDEDEAGESNKRRRGDDLEADVLAPAAKVAKTINAASSEAE